MYEEDDEEIYVVPMKEYEVPWWVKWLHSLPHWDLTFEAVSSSHNLNDPKYKESLMFWVAIPIMCLLLTLFLFLVYFCYRCCQQDPGKRRKLTCLKWTLSILMVISCGFIALGMYGNEDTNKGVNNIAAATSDITFTVNKIKMQISALHRTTNTTVSRGIEEISAIFKTLSQQRPPDKEFYIEADKAKGFARSIQDSMAEIYRKLQDMDFHPYIATARKYELYRRSGTWATFGWLLLLCLILLVGIGRNSKCTLLLFCAFGIFSLVLSWLFAGIHLGVAVGMGDFCSDPDPVVEGYALEHVEMSIIHYYIKCDNSIAANPFNEALRRVTDYINEANASFIKATEAADKHFGSHEFIRSKQLVDVGLTNMKAILMSINALIDCTNVHKDYIDVLEGVCYFTLPGVLFMFLSSVTTGLLFSALVVVSSKTWRVVGINYDDDSPKSYTDQDEEEGGPFMSQIHHHHQAPPSPLYYSFPKARQAHIAAHNRRTTPPPAYNSNEFYRQYSDINTPEDGRADYTIRESNA